MLLMASYHFSESDPSAFELVDMALRDCDARVLEAGLDRSGLLLEIDAAMPRVHEKLMHRLACLPVRWHKLELRP
jgi:hypothetical protein